MIRFAWLQTRAQAYTAAVCLLVLVALTLATGPHLAHLYNNDVVPCTSTHAGCSFQLESFFNHDLFLQNAFQLVIRLVPALIGIFWGAPLFARELETGTFRVAWTQGVSRTRWILTKLALGATYSILAAGIYTLAVTWWYRSFDLANNNVHSFSVFDQRGLVAVGYALFAFALGTLVGAVLRRVLPAMTATLAVFVFVRVAIGLWLRPHLMPPLHKTASLLGGGFTILYNGSVSTIATQYSSPNNDWVLSSRLVNNAGQPVKAAAQSAFVHQHCTSVAHGAIPGSASVSSGGHHLVVVGPASPQLQQCQTAAARYFHLLVTYQPASRFWPFQWIETGIFAALAVAAFVACFWWVKRRIA
ncbi:MAG TPA: ABC transporter permease [Mycobacteriales bacterium]|nr:ABC transporter permease [Mycobacteriales bacterium]